MFKFDFTNFSAKEYFFGTIINGATLRMLFFHYLRTINKNNSEYYGR